MNLHGSEVLVPRTFEASQSKIIWWYADLPLLTSLQSNVSITVLDHYLFICLFKNLRLGCTRSWCAKPQTGLCFDTLEV